MSFCSVNTLTGQYNMTDIPLLKQMTNSFNQGKAKRIDQLFVSAFRHPPPSPASTSILTRAAQLWLAGLLHWFQCEFMCVCVCVCVYCRVLWNSSAKESPHWPTFSKHAMTVSWGDPTQHRFSCLQLDLSSSHRASSDFVFSGPGRKGARHLERLPLYLSELRQMWAFVTMSSSSQTTKVLTVCGRACWKSSNLAYKVSWCVSWSATYGNIFQTEAQVIVVFLFMWTLYSSHGHDMKWQENTFLINKMYLGSFPSIREKHI